MEKVYFEEVNGKKIFCYFSDVETSDKKIVIMSHGFRGSSLGPARQFVDFQKLLNKEGYSVLRLTNHMVAIPRKIILTFRIKNG